MDEASVQVTRAVLCKVDDDCIAWGDEVGCRPHFFGCNLSSYRVSVRLQVAVSESYRVVPRYVNAQTGREQPAVDRSQNPPTESSMQSER